MTAPLLISIVVPAFNAASVLGDTLRSVQQQDYPHIEAIVVDDGSTDATASVAQAVAAEDPRFTILTRSHRGIAAARNAGVAAARGTWIAFLDADDVWFPHKLSCQVQRAQERPSANFIFSNYYRWDGERDIELRHAGHDPLRRFPQELARFNLVGTSTVMVTAELLARVGPFDEALTLAEDWDLWLRLAEAGCSALWIPEPLGRYRTWGGNTSARKLEMAGATVRVLEKRMAQCGDRRWRRWYQRSLAVARGNLEFATVRPLLDGHPGALARATDRAWRACPWRLKWLLWTVGVRCPERLGGHLFRQHVRQHIEARW